MNAFFIQGATAENKSTDDIGADYVLKQFIFIQLIKGALYYNKVLR